MGVIEHWKQKNVSKWQNRVLLALDMDGTTIGSSGQMTPGNCRAMERIRRAGHVTAFVTGRRMIDMNNLAQECRCTDYLILNNGGKIIRESDGLVEYNRLVRSENCEKLMKYCCRNGINLQICHDDWWMVREITDDVAEYAGELGVDPGRYDDYREVNYQGGLEGFMVMDHFKQVKDYLDAELPGVTCVMSEPDCVDIYASGISKWNGIHRLARTEGIEPANIIAVGNYYNDLDMIENASIGIAVANAIDEVKEEADYITCCSNEEDVIAEIANVFFGL